MRIKADRDVCIGAGLCAMTAPDIFDQSADDGRVLLLTVNPEPELAAAAREAISLCPSGALSFCEGDEDVVVPGPDRTSGQVRSRAPDG